MRHAIAVMALLLFAGTTPAAEKNYPNYYNTPLALKIHPREYYSPEDILDYQSALKRKQFGAQVQWKPLLVVAADIADVNSLRWMLENGSKADIADRSGRTGLFHLATRDPQKRVAAYAEIAQLLLLSGADPNRFASGTSVIRTMTSGNRDIALLKVLLEFGANPDGHRHDLYPPVCGAGTPAFIDLLSAAGAHLHFPERDDFRNVADCLALEDIDKKERKLLWAHLKASYGIEQTAKRKSADAAVSDAVPAVQPATLPAGNYLFAEQSNPPPPRGEEPVHSIEWRVLDVATAMPRNDIIEQLVRPTLTPAARAQVTATLLRKCADDCVKELADLRQFLERNRLPRSFKPGQNAGAGPVTDAAMAVSAP